jgi:hypothetical protein
MYYSFLIDVANVFNVQVNSVIIYSIVKGSTIVTGSLPGGNTASEAQAASNNYNTNSQSILESLSTYQPTGLTFTAN